MILGHRHPAVIEAISSVFGKRRQLWRTHRTGSRTGRDDRRADSIGGYGSNGQLGD